MDYLQNLLTDYSSYCQLVVFLLCFIVSWNIENFTGLKFEYKKWKHAFINFPFSITNLPGQLILGFAFVATIHWTGDHKFGLIYLLPKGLNSFAMFLISFVLLDFGEYIYHIIMHKIRSLWKFHIVHHSDDVVDVSTTFREHPGENVIRLLFTLTWVFLTGTLFWMLVLRQIIQAFTTLFAHMNYSLPHRVDKILGLLFITPNLHQVHHHYQQPYTDCNYGDVLSIWDRMFGTFKTLDRSAIVFGIDTFQGQDKLKSFAGLAGLPFLKWRKYKNG